MVVVGHLVERARRGDTGVVDEHVDRCERPVDRGDERIDGCRIGDVELMRERRAAGARYELRRLLQLLDPPGADRDRPAQTAQGNRDCSSDPGRGAGHGRDPRPVRQSIHRR